MENIFLETKNVKAFREALGVLEDAEKGQPGLGIIWGKAGRGKTICSKEYVVRTGAIYIRVMQDWTARAMLSAICREINGSEYRTVDKCKRSICDELESSPRTVLIDEADRLDVRLIEHFRDIHDMTGVPIVLIGENSLFPTLKVRERIWSRITQNIRFDDISAEDIMLFGIKSAQIKIEPAAAGEIEKRCKGDFRLVWIDVRDLARICRASRTDMVTPEMVKELEGANNVRN